MGKFKWFLIGGVLGAGAALALAPQTGEETRALVAEKANAFAGEAKDFGAGLPDSAVEAIKSARDQGASLVQGAQDKTAGLVSEVKGGSGAASSAEADELREKIEAARQRIAAQVMENAEKSQIAAGEAVEEAKHAAQ